MIDRDLRNKEFNFIFKILLRYLKIVQRTLVLKEKDTNLRIFLISFICFHVWERDYYIMNYCFEKTYARYLSIWLQKRMTNAYFSIDVPFPIPRMIYMAIN